MTKDMNPSLDMDEIEDILDDIRSRFDETPNWEFCEGFIAALVCCRRTIPSQEYLDVLLEAEAFTDTAQRERFVVLWDQRMQQVQESLDIDIDSLENEAAYQPEIMDMRGIVADLSEEERPDMQGHPIPSFAQVWALGFMYAVEAWREEWEAPTKDKKIAKAHDEALEAIVALTEDDEGDAEISPYGEDAPPSMSLHRLNVYADALWAVYDLRAIWSQIGARVPTLQRANLPGRNDPCHCGSGKKFKKCCGK